MKKNKLKKILEITEELKSIGHYVEEFGNGHIRVAGIDFWCTTETYYNGKLKHKGLGYKNFKDYLETLGGVKKNE